ncbi:MAG: hypothetical protein IJY12_05340, partial [Clostridia bacterium]|nr:hypothetical protein [Clostridia bacterium]
MVNIKVLKAPGFLLDLNFLFYLKFNPQHYTENIVDKKKTEEYEKYRKDILQHFGDIPDSLYIFYKVIDSDRCFMTANYIDPYREEFPLGFDFKDFMDKLLDTDRLIENMIHFYLYDFPKDERMECVASSAKLFSCIKA